MKGREEISLVFGGERENLSMHEIITHSIVEIIIVKKRDIPFSVLINLFQMEI